MLDLARELQMEPGAFRTELQPGQRHHCPERGPNREAVL